MSRAYTVASLAQEWECSEGVIRKLIAAEQLRAFRIGALIRIPADEVERFECQNTASNDSAAASQSFTETQPETATESAYRPRTALGQKRRLGGDGRPETVLRGPWDGS